MVRLRLYVTTPAMCAIAAAVVCFLMIPQIVYSSDRAGRNDVVVTVLFLSRGLVIVFLELYALYTFFRLQLASEFLDERVFVGEDVDRRLFSSVPTLVVLGLALLTASVNGAYVVDRRPYLWEHTHISKAFVGMILVPRSSAARNWRQ